MKAVILLRDAKNIHYWSGLPFYLSQAFVSTYGDEATIIQAKYYFRIPELLFNYFIARLYRIFYQFFGIKISYSFTGSWLYRLIVNILFFLHRNKINKNDYLLSIIAPYGAKRWIKVPIVAFSDGSYEFLVKWQLKRTLIGPEATVNQKSYDALSKSSMVICLFRQVYNDLVAKGIHPSELYYFPGGLNLGYIKQKTDDDIRAKFNRKTILFIGRKHYKDGAVKLLEAFNYVKRVIPETKLVIIGLTIKDLSVKIDNSDIKVIPYLDKTKSEDLKLYTKFIEEATLFVNVAEIGGAYMATLETMAYGTPFILKSYPEIVAFMSDMNSCGLLLNRNIEAIELSEILFNLLTDYSKWSVYSKNAADIASKMKWEKLFYEIENILNL